ncbi:hypothetical protein KFE25_011915 [Diacronema lutheri]|uniref:Uncharacterized protein n=1 Tax=Diacronema lutheri TaxID=2081491 RepID=A0A8J5XAD8_DIALT|nr:hypothetical protein KFE25_011915 [Diacronema lutheri]
MAPARRSALRCAATLTIHLLLPSLVACAKAGVLPAPAPAPTPVEPVTRASEEGTLDRWRAYLAAVYSEPTLSNELARDMLGSLEWVYRCSPGPLPFDPFDAFAVTPRARAALARSRPPVHCAHLPPDAPTRDTPRIVSLLEDVPMGAGFMGANWTDGMQAHEPYGFFVRARGAPAPAPENTWIEVLRVRNPYEGEEGHAHGYAVHGRMRFGGTWYYAVRGSGVWLNVGRTLVVNKTWPSHARQQIAINEARRAGYDTLQYPWLWQFGMHEVVDLRTYYGRAAMSAARERAQPSARVCPPAGVLRAGLRAQLECGCSEAQRLLNCGGALAAHAGASATLDARAPLVSAQVFNERV